MGYALKYKTSGQWSANSGFCKTARENGWFKQCISHMKLNTADLREKRAVDSLIRMIKKQITKKVKREQFLIRGFPDLTLFIKGKVVLVEVKHDKSQWKREDVQEQIDRYKQDGEKTYDNFHDCLLTSPNGR